MLLGVTVIDVLQAMMQHSPVSMFPAILASLAVPIACWTLLQVKLFKDP